MKLFMFARILLLLVFTISLLLISIFCVITSNFKTVASTQSFLAKAAAYTHISDIVKLEVRTYFPPVVANNFVLNGLTNKLLDFIVTPALVEQASAPALKLAYGFANSPTAIVSDKVVVETALYKNQAKQAIAEVGLPRILVVNADFLVDNLPGSLTLVDLEKNPNSILGLIIKARTAFENAQKILSYSYIALILSAFFIIVLNLHRLRFMVKEFFVGTVISGSILLITCLALPGIISMNLPTGGSLIQAQNNLILDAVKVVLSEMRTTSYMYLGISAVLLAILLFIHFDRIQKAFDRKLKRVHVPQVSVHIK